MEKLDEFKHQMSCIVENCELTEKEFQRSILGLTSEIFYKLYREAEYNSMEEIIYEKLSQTIGDIAEWI